MAVPLRRFRFKAASRDSVFPLSWVFVIRQPTLTAGGIVV